MSILSKKINALFVETDGIYFNDKKIDPWDINRDAFNCKNGAPAICHPPAKDGGATGLVVRAQKLKD